MTSQSQMDIPRSKFTVVKGFDLDPKLPTGTLISTGTSDPSGAVDTNDQFHSLSYHDDVHDDSDAVGVVVGGGNDAVPATTAKKFLLSLSSSSPCVPVPSTTANKIIQCPLQYWDVYIDDFLGLIQGNKYHRRRIKRALLHAMDKVFRPLDPADNTLPSRTCFGQETFEKRWDVGYSENHS